MIMNNPKSISLIFPLYRDKYTVIKVINKSLKILKKLKIKYEIIIVDDCCPEKSGLIALKHSKKNKKIKVIFHKKNFGYGAAIRSGFKNSKYECVYAVDGDGEFGIALNDLPRILKKYSFNDLVITYRYKKRYKTSRIIISWFYNRLLRFLFDIKFKDISCGSRLVNKKILKRIKLTTNSPFIGAELAIKAKYFGYKVDEVGIHSYPSNFRAGSSIVLKNILITIRDVIILYYKIYIKKKIN
jgi:glycosyltransferase involved in cell wall biosynthesis